MFEKFAKRVTKFTGSAQAFSIAMVIIVVWLITGFFNYWNEAHTTLIHIFTTIITFLMVFVLQHGQNKDTLAMHKKMDELIRATEGARNDMAGLEKQPVEKIKEADIKE
jgi:low affinity Fe/Cu permease